jgi:hypothetical protein
MTWPSDAFVLAEEKPDYLDVANKYDTCHRTSTKKLLQVQYTTTSTEYYCSYDSYYLYCTLLE